MTREEKKVKKLARAAFRRNKRTDIYLRKITTANKVDFNVPLSNIDKYGNLIISCWSDSDSKTGYTQICDWSGTCDYPCNGDC